MLKTPLKTAVFYKNGAPFLPKTNEIWYRKSTWHRIFIRNVTQTWETSQCNKNTDLQRQQNMTKYIMRNKSETTFSLYLERWLFFIHFNHKFLKIRPHLYQEQAAKGYIALTFWGFLQIWWAGFLSWAQSARLITGWLDRWQWGVTLPEPSPAPSGHAIHSTTEAADLNFCPYNGATAKRNTDMSS